MTRSALLRLPLLPLTLLLLATATAIALSAGFLGRMHPALDAFSHLRLHLAALLAVTGVLLLATRFRREGVFAVILAAGSVAATPGIAINSLLRTDAQADQATGKQAVYRLLQFNGRYENQTPEAFLSLVGRTRPDVVTIEEVSPMWSERLETLGAAYPHKIVCDARARKGGIAILSRRPFLEGTEPGCLDDGNFALATVDLGGQAVQVAAIHLFWPWPNDQPQQVKRLSAVLNGLSGKSILAGDFNAVRWSSSFNAIEDAASMQDAGPTGPTWLPLRLPDALRPLVGLGLDHVLIGSEIFGRSIQRMEHAGSDHLPLLFEFSVKPDEPATAPTTDVVAKPAAPSPIS